MIGATCWTIDLKRGVDDSPSLRRTTFERINLPERDSKANGGRRKQGHHQQQTGAIDIHGWCPINRSRMCSVRQRSHIMIGLFNLYVNEFAT